MKKIEVYDEIVQYCKAQKVKVVNMSWSIDFQSVEQSFAYCKSQYSRKERLNKARIIFAILKSALYQAMKKAPEILFVNAAGNRNDNPIFQDCLPTSFGLPNLLVVGAVDNAGQQTHDTCFGTSVDVYARGHYVESFLPGGRTMPVSGTSAAAPQVTKLATQLLSINPALTPQELIGLIKEGATRQEQDQCLPGDCQLRIKEFEYRVLHPKRTLDLLREKYPA